MESTTANIPTWLGVAASATLVLIAILDLVARTPRARAARWRWQLFVRWSQLAVVGALLLFVFDQGGLPAAFGWLAVMVVIAGFVAGGRARGIPRARSHAWWGIGVAVTMTMGLLARARHHRRRAARGHPGGRHGGQHRDGDGGAGAPAHGRRRRRPARPHRGTGWPSGCRHARRSWSRTEPPCEPRSSLRSTPPRWSG